MRVPSEELGCRVPQSTTEGPIVAVLIMVVAVLIVPVVTVIIMVVAVIIMVVAVIVGLRSFGLHIGHVPMMADAVAIGIHRQSRDSTTRASRRPAWGCHARPRVHRIHQAAKPSDASANRY